MTLRRIGIVAAVAAAGILGGGSAAHAHVQVLPAVVAPLDAVRFTIIVPGESNARTTRVELQLPPDLLPFAWEDVPGWKRRIVPGNDPASVGNVIWTGRLATDGFVEFSFLAGTPQSPGEISWKAIQTYDDGTVVRWVGPPGSEEPAAVTLVSEDAPRQDAGGETGGGGTETTPTETTETAPTEPETAPTETETTAAEEPAAEEHGEAVASTSTEEGDDWIARGLALIAVVTAFAAIAFVLLARRPRSGDSS
jgi:uncharacterized protein YcnI